MSSPPHGPAGSLAAASGSEERRGVSRASAQGERAAPKGPYAEQGDPSWESSGSWGGKLLVPKAQGGSEHHAPAFPCEWPAGCPWFAFTYEYPGRHGVGQTENGGQPEQEEVWACLLLVQVCAELMHGRACSGQWGAPGTPAWAKHCVHCHILVLETALGGLLEQRFFPDEKGKASGLLVAQGHGVSELRRSSAPILQTVHRCLKFTFN